MNNSSGSKEVIGISFGSLYCAIAVNCEGVPISVLDSEGYNVFPSLIYILPDGKFLVGQQAKRLQVVLPQEIISGDWIMQFGGRNYNNEEIIEIQKKIPVKISIDQEGKILFEIKQKTYNLTIVCAMMLKKFKDTAEIFLGKKVDEAVVSIPDCFYQNSSFIIDSGHQAGFSTVTVVSRSEAVVKNFSKFKRKDSIAICDLSENIFNISIGKICDGFNIDINKSDNILGEERIMENLVKWVIHDFKRQYGIDLQDDRIAVARIKDAVNRARLELAIKPEREFIPRGSLLELGTTSRNSPDSTEVLLPFLYKDHHYDGALTYRDIQQIIADIKQQTISLMQKTIEKEKLTSHSIDEVIILGEKSTISELNSTIKTYWNRDPLCVPEPHETGAKGALLCSKNYRGVLSLDVTPLSLGVETMRGMMMVIIPRNTIIPTRESLIFSTEEDNQTSVEIQVCQGERPMATENIKLGKFSIEGISPKPKGLTRIEIAFDIDINGIVKVTAKDLATGKEQKITIAATSHLSKDELDKIANEKGGEDLFSIEHIAEIILDELCYGPKGERNSFRTSEESKNEEMEIFNRFTMKNIYEGGMGRVYIVSTPGHKTFAIKTCKNEFVHSSDAIEQFVREASTWIKLGKHKNIVVAYSIQKIVGKPCIFLEYISGGTLRNYILSNTSNISKSLNFSLQICEGMDFAYNKLRLVHRDLKPDNILITDNGIAKITDFGLVKALDYLPDDIEVKEGKLNGIFLSKVGIVAGTPAYMSPEQFIMPKFVDTRSDIYSFGVMFYEILTGRLPFTASTFGEYELKHINGNPFDPMILNQKIPEEVSLIVMKCLQKYPEKRYQTFQDLKMDIKRIYEKMGGSYSGTVNTGLSTAHDLTLDGFLLLNLNNYKEAMDYFNNAIDLDSKYGLAWAGKGTSLFKVGKFNDAKSCFYKTLEINPDLKIIEKIKTLINSKY
jgi:molecular chaperone DnaK